MPAATIYHRLGDTFSWAGVVSLPTGNTWAAECGLRNTLASPAPALPDFTIPATLTLIGVDPQNSTLNNYTLLLAQDGPTTITWANLITLSGTATLLLAIKFYNTASPAVQLTTAPINLVL